MPTVVYGDFEWDAAKASANALKHGVAFEDAAQAMTDPYAVDFDDRVNPSRIVTLAMSRQGSILYVVSTDRGSRVRIISARSAASHERRIYEEDA